MPKISSFKKLKYPGSATLILWLKLIRISEAWIHYMYVPGYKGNPDLIQYRQAGSPKTSVADPGLRAFFYPGIWDGKKILIRDPE
jgi:hypothetical protein